MSKRYFVVKGGEGSGRYPKGGSKGSPAYTFEQPRYPDNEGWSPEHPLEGNLGTITPEIEGENRTFDLGTIARSMAEASLWSTGEMDDKSFYDINPDDAYGLIGVVTDFVRNNLSDLVASDLSDDEIGHDLSLTIDGHGSGFWDRGLGKIGENLTQACKSYIGSTPEVGDDGQVYLNLNPTVRKGGSGSGRYPKGSGGGYTVGDLAMSSSSQPNAIEYGDFAEISRAAEEHDTLADECYAQQAQMDKEAISASSGVDRKIALEAYDAYFDAGIAHEKASDLAKTAVALLEQGDDWIEASEEAVRDASLASQEAAALTEKAITFHSALDSSEMPEQWEGDRQKQEEIAAVRTAAEQHYAVGFKKGGSGSGRYPAGSHATVALFHREGAKEHLREAKRHDILAEEARAKGDERLGVRLRSAGDLHREAASAHLDAEKVNLKAVGHEDSWGANAEIASNIAQYLSDQANIPLGQVTEVYKGGSGSGRYPAGSSNADRMNSLSQRDKAHAEQLATKAGINSTLVDRNPEDQSTIQTHISLADEYAGMAELVKREMNEIVGAPMLARSFATDLYGALREAYNAHTDASDLGMQMLDSIGKDEEERDGMISEESQSLASDFTSASRHAADLSQAVAVIYADAPLYTEVSGEMFRNKARFTKGGSGSGRFPKGSGLTTTPKVIGEIKGVDGRPFRVTAHLMPDNAKYGAGRPIIAFHDFSQDPTKFGEHGQFVSSYYAKTLANGGTPTGLDLQGDVPFWKISATEMAKVTPAIRAIADTDTAPLRTRKSVEITKGGSGSGRFPKGSKQELLEASQMVADFTDDSVTGDAVPALHRELAEDHAIYAEKAREAGDDAGAVAHSRASIAHEEAADIHEQLLKELQDEDADEDTRPSQEAMSATATANELSQEAFASGLEKAHFRKGGAGSGRYPAGISGLVAQSGNSAKKALVTETIPENCLGRDFFPDQTIAQIGRMNILAISGGRVNPIMVGKRTVGIELPVGKGYKVRVYLADNDTYTVQRVTHTASGEKVKGELTDVYADEVGEQAYQASCFISNPFGGHNPN